MSSWTHDHVGLSPIDVELLSLAMRAASVALKTNVVALIASRGGQGEIFTVNVTDNDLADWLARSDIPSLVRNMKRTT